MITTEFDQILPNPTQIDGFKIYNPNPQIEYRTDGVYSILGLTTPDKRHTIVYSSERIEDGYNSEGRVSEVNTENVVFLLIEKVSSSGRTVETQHDERFRANVINLAGKIRAAEVIQLEDIPNFEP